MQRNHTEKFDVANFRLFVFQPGEKFYSQTFERKLALLEAKILAARTYLTSHPEIKKSLFVAPEYLFKDMGKQGENKYYSHEQKQKYKALLTKLSHDTDLIIAPGTICWQKKSDKYERTLYRNMIYFFHRGNVEKYKKTLPHPYHDYDYLEGRSHKDKVFSPGTNDALIKNINGISIGIEICFDHVCKILKRKKPPQDKIDIHLVVAAGVEDKYVDSCSVKEGGAYIKIEKSSEGKATNKISTLRGPTPKFGEMLVNASLETTIIADLNCYNLKSPNDIDECKLYNQQAGNLITELEKKINERGHNIFLANPNMKDKALKDLATLLKNKLAKNNVNKEFFNEVVKEWKKMTSEWENLRTKEKMIFNNGNINSNHRNILFSESRPGKPTKTEEFIYYLEDKYAILKL